MSYYHVDPNGIPFEAQMKQTALHAEQTIRFTCGVIDHRIEWLSQEGIDPSYGEEVPRRIERMTEIHRLLTHGPEWWANNHNSSACSIALGIVKIYSAIDLIDYMTDEIKRDPPANEATLKQSLSELDIIRRTLLTGADDDGSE